ncbi:YlbF family regulator [Gemmiger formicilis]|uniref:YlbF family regulator n=1 Tax=Gemmiger formicilis TaxID=745368 RepID=UPI003AADE8A2
MAATIYEPLSTAHLKACTVDFDSRPDKKAVNLVQYDQTIPVLCVSLKKGGTEYKVPSDADVNIRMDKRDGYHVYNPALGVNAERAIAYFAVTPQMSTGWGDYYPIVEITVGGGVAGSAPIWLHFDRNPLPENAIISSDEYKTIQQLLEDVKAVKADTEAIKTATEQIKAQTEAVRDQAKGFADNAKNSADKAQTLVDGMPSDYSQAMKDIGTLKNQMQLAYPDDSTIGENTWSSKNIVDMLCPPLEESGNPVVCYPVAGYPLGVKASWEPVQEGSGNPSPENIRPIKGRDSVKVERCGKNLLPFGERIENIYRQQIMTSDDLLLLSKAYAGQKVTLTFSVETQNIVFNDVVEDQLRKRIGFECNGTLADGTETYSLQCWLDNRDGELSKNGRKTKTVTITMPELAAGDIKFYAQNIKSGSFVAYGFGIYAGTTDPTTYTPYIGQTNTLTLPETVYGGEVDAVTGEGQKVWKSVALDGTENWNTWGVNKNNTNVTGFFTYDINDYSNDGSDINKILCSTMSNEEKNIWGGKNMGVGLANSGNSKYLIYCVTTNTLPDTTDDKKAIASFKTFLANLYAAGTPVQVAYKLATQTPFTATGAQPMPALAGANTVLTDADSATVTGRADPIKRITDLEDAVASQT